jgi:hypothetical protein
MHPGFSSLGNRRWRTSAALVIATTTTTFAYVGGSPVGMTGAPGDVSCVMCHTTYPLNSGGGGLHFIQAPYTYTPGQTHTFWVEMEDAGMQRWGFQLTALDAGGQPLGTIRGGSEDSTQVIVAYGREYLDHRYLGACGGDPGPVQWRVEWTAPIGGGNGPVTFYVAGLSANADAIAVGDYTYTLHWTAEEGAPVLDLMLRDLPTAATVGDFVEFTTTICNPGMNTVACDALELELRGPGVAQTLSLALHGDETVLTVPPGKTIRNSFRIPIPDTAPQGDYRAEITLSTAGKQLDREHFDITLNAGAPLAD